MNMFVQSRRNAPPPLIHEVYTDCGLSERTPIVIRLCKKTNEILEFLFGMEAPQVDVPGQGNVDERMPLMFLRPCIEMINRLGDLGTFNIKPVPVPGSSMDYHGFVPLARSVAEGLNAIIGELNGQENRAEEKPQRLRRY